MYKEIYGLMCENGSKCGKIIIRCIIVLWKYGKCKACPENLKKKYSQLDFIAIFPK